MAVAVSAKPRSGRGSGGGGEGGKGAGVRSFVHSFEKYFFEKARADGRASLHVENARVDGRASLHVEIYVCEIYDKVKLILAEVVFFTMK